MTDHRITNPKTTLTSNTLTNQPTSSLATNIIPTVDSDPTPAMAPTPKPSPLPLTLILAATPSLGIGRNGTLPWPQLKQEMAYFARVTKRVPPPSPQQRSASGVGRRCNAVVMGRKTWESIPERFRPLKERVNVVVTRDPDGFKGVGGEGVEGPVIVGSVGAAIKRLEGMRMRESEGDRQDLVQVERVFVIGGASIYKATLEMEQAEQVLLTRIERDYECDTFFPMDLEKEGSGWRRVGVQGMREFTGEEVEEGGVEEGGVKFVFGMYERVR